MPHRPPLRRTRHTAAPCSRRLAGAGSWRRWAVRWQRSLTSWHRCTAGTGGILTAGDRPRGSCWRHATRWLPAVLWRQSQGASPAATATASAAPRSCCWMSGGSPLAGFCKPRQRPTCRPWAGRWTNLAPRRGCWSCWCRAGCCRRCVCTPALAASACVAPSVRPATLRC